MKIVWVGYGDLGHQLEQTLLERGDHIESRVCCDDVAFQAGQPDSVPFADYMDRKYADYQFFVALGYRHSKRKQAILHELQDAGRQLFSYIGKTTQISPSAKIGGGAFLDGGGIGINAVIGLGATLNGNTLVGHDCKIGDAIFCGGLCVIGGNSVVGDRTFLGLGTLIRNGLKIGSDCRIGMGSVVMRNVRDGASGFGNPFRRVDADLDF